MATDVQVFPDAAGSYKEHSAGPRWKAIRARVLKTAQYKCACCPNPATEVHHRDYRPRVLRGEDDSALVALGRDCHRNVDKLPDGSSRKEWHEEEAILAEMARQDDRRLVSSGGNP